MPSANTPAKGKNAGSSFFGSLRFRVLLCLAVVLTLIVAVTFAGGVLRSKEQAIAAASEKAGALAQQMDVLWDYLETHPDAARAAEGTVSGETGPVCIISVKSVAERFSDASNTTIRYTSLRPRNTLDAPDEFEQTAMELFEEDHSIRAYEATALSPSGEERYRYLQPLYADESCLSCHGSPEGEIDSLGYPKEGYSSGDLIGAISITTPMLEYYQTSWRDVLGWFALLLLALTVAGLSLLYVINRTVLKPVTNLQEAVRNYREGEIGYRIEEPRGADELVQLGRDVNEMAEELQDLYSGLEQRVESRTAELTKLNDTLSAMLTDQQQNLDIAIKRVQEERDAMARRVLEPIAVGAFEFDQARFEVRKQGAVIPLTPKEFNVLFALASRAGEVVSQRELVEIAWGEGFTEEMASLPVYIRRIRKKIEDNPDRPSCIQTVRGEGYRFSVEGS